MVKEQYHYNLCSTLCILNNKVDKLIEKMGEWRTEIGKCKINENNGDISVNSNDVSLNTKQVAVDKVSNNDDSNNELTSDNNDIIKNGVLESKVVNMESDDEDFVEVEFNNEVVASVDEMGRVCEERLGGQRADFPKVYCEMEGSHVFYEDEGSSRGYVGDMVSPKSPLSCCSDVSLSLIHI